MATETRTLDQPGSGLKSLNDASQRQTFANDTARQRVSVERAAQRVNPGPGAVPEAK